ncbi:MAG: hypothetical protein ACE5F6_09775 [Anaerolineae bacterium]
MADIAHSHPTNYCWSTHRKEARHAPVYHPWAASALMFLAIPTPWPFSLGG